MSKKVLLEEPYGVYFPHNDNDTKSPKKGCMGVIEIVVRDRNGRVVEHWFEPNIVKIFAKEILSHRLPSSQVWDPTANGGSGAWVNDNIDPTEEFSARYILFGASFDQTGSPVDNDPRYYQKDSATGIYVPIRLGPGAEYNGELINAIPISEPSRPLKKVEKIGFEATYQPSGLPLLQDDVRAINNIVTLQTTLKLNEYNGFGLTGTDFFVITEIALAAGKKYDNVGACELTPRKLFLQGTSGSGASSGSGAGLLCTASGSDVISISPSESEVDLVKTGDQIEIVAPGGSSGDTSLNQVSPFYLIMNKAVGGRDITLDRTPVDKNNNPIVGQINIYRDTLRIYSHRILKTPFRKSCDFEIDVIWRIIFN